MADNSTVETDVFLGVDGRQISTAFNAIDERIAKIQKHIDQITVRSKEAANAFGGNLQNRIGELNKTLGALDKFERSMNKLYDKHSPQGQTNVNWQTYAKEKAEADAAELQRVKQVNQAYSQREQQLRNDLDKRSRQEAAMWAKRDRDAMSDEKKQEQLAERRYNYEQARETRLQAERERGLKQQAQLTDQNRFKIAKDKVGTDVGGARTLLELEKQRGIAADRLVRAREMLGKFGADEDRQLLQTIALEKERQRLADAGIAAKKKELQPATSDGRIDRSLDLRSSRINEATYATTLKLNEALGRQLALETEINNKISQTRRLKGEEKIAAESALKEDEARLVIIKARVRELEKEALAEKRAAEATNKPTAGPAPLFGKTGLTGVVARTAAYGGASMALFGAYNMAQSGAAFTIQWEEALAQLAAIANATAPEMVQLKGAIEGIGESSKFSLIDLTNMATKLAQAGVAVSSMKDALSATSTLAAASGSTPDEAVDLVTASLGAFQLQGKEAGRVADEMTSALNRTRLTVQQTAEAIQYVGATAYEQNISLEQLLALVGTLSQAGIRSGSTIGTGSRQFLTDLLNPSAKLTEQFKRLGITMDDVNVSTRGLPSVLQTLADKGFGAAQAYNGLEKRAAAFYLVAKNNLPFMNQLQMALADQGAAAIAQERAMNSLAGQWQRFKNILGESFSSSAGEILTVAKNLLQQISDRMIQIRTTAEQNKKSTSWMDYDLKPGLERALEVGLNMALPRTGYGPNSGVGTWLKNLSRDTNDATGKQQELETQMHQTNQATDEQRDTVGALDHEIVRLIAQKESLRGKTQLVTAETVTLMSRFKGLSANIMGATGDIGGLIGALQRLRDQEAQTLIQNIGDQAGVLQARVGDARISRNAAIQQIKGNAGLYGAMTPKERGALVSLDGPNGRIAADLLLRAAQRFSESNTEWAKLLQQAGANQQTMFSAQGQRGVLLSEQGKLIAGQTPFGKQVGSNLQTVEGMLEGFRTATGDKQKNQKITLELILNKTEAGINAKLKLGQTAATREFLLNALAEVQSDRAQIKDIVTPSDKDAAKADRAASKAAQLISFGSPVKGPIHINSGVGARSSPGGIGSTNHQGIDIRGSEGEEVFAVADGVVTHAGPQGGYGNLVKIDHGLGTETRYGHLSVVDVVVGQEVSKGERIGRIGHTGHATGPHLHFERRLNGKIDTHPLSGSAPGSAAAASDKAQSLAQKEKDRAEREVKAREDLALKNADKTLTDKLGDLKYATSDAVFDAGKAQVDTAFDAWAIQLKKTTEADLDKREATASERNLRMEEIKEQIRQRRKEIDDSLFDFMMKSIDKQLALIDQAFKLRMEPAEQAAAAAQGAVQGLGYQSLAGKVPDYVQRTAERNAAKAQEALDRTKSGALGDKISDTQSTLANAQQRLGNLTDPGQVEEAKKKIDDLKLSVEDLTAQKMQLDAALGASGLIPQTFSEGLHMALEDFREAHNLTQSWGDMIRNNLGGAIDTVSSSMEEFLTNVMSGTMSIKQAFATMVKGIIQYLIQLIAKMIVVKLLQIAIGAMGGGKGEAPVPTWAEFNGGAVGNFNGGEIGRSNGGAVENGVPGRDSVRTKLAKGEFVQRKWAVDNVGRKFMADLNNRGADAIRAAAPTLALPAPAHQEMKVFVVANDEKPQMGPNDVLAVINGDILKGGQTKRLIKHVAQGG